MFVRRKGKIFLVGGKNKRFLKYLADEGFVDSSHLKFIEVVDTVEDLKF
jgi:hypothetical protein